MIKQCEICGKEFSVKKSVAQKGLGRFCSRACLGKWHSLTFSGENSPYWKGGDIECECEVCDTKFYANAARVKSGKARFCSNKCSGIWYSGNVRGKAHPLYKRIRKSCQECGKEIWVTPSRAKAGKGKFCSKECYGRWQSKNIKGKRHPNWKEKIVKMCEVCGKCAEACPGKAISADDPTFEGPTLSNNHGICKWYINPERCFQFWVRNKGDCANCIRVCVFNKPDTWFHNFVRWQVKHIPRFDSLYLWGDDLFGYGKRMKMTSVWE